MGNLPDRYTGTLTIYPEDKDFVSWKISIHKFSYNSKRPGKSFHFPCSILTTPDRFNTPDECFDDAIQNANGFGIEVNEIWQSKGFELSKNKWKIHLNRLKTAKAIERLERKEMYSSKHGLND